MPTSPRHIEPVARGRSHSLASRVMARMQLGVTLGDAETSDIVAFLESLTGELPANFDAGVDPGDA